MRHLLPLMIAIPMGAAMLIPILTRKREELAGHIAVGVQAVLTLMSFILVGKKPLIYAMGNWLPPFGINLVLDKLSVLLLLIVNIVTFAAVLFSVPYMQKYTGLSKYYSLLLLMLAGMNGVVLTGDIFNFYVFLEVATIASYALVGFGCHSDELEASLKYLILGSVGSTLIVFGIGATYALTGTLNMAHLAKIMSGQGNSNAVLLITSLFIAGFCLKAGVAPFHAWLPDAHPAAPAPISAMLSGVIIKVLGIYGIMRIVLMVIGVTPLVSMILLALGVFSMVVGSFMAIFQEDFKRLLAYSSVSHMGIILLALGIGTPLAYLGAIFHLMNHAFFKSLMFLVTGSIQYSTGTRDLSKMGGLIKVLPVTGASASIGAMSTSGVPPFNGFWSKLLILYAAVKSGHYGVAMALALVSFFTLGYYTRVQKNVLFGPLPEALKNFKEVPLPMKLSIAGLAFLCVMIGLLVPIINPLLLEPAREALVNTAGYITLVLGG